MFARKPKPEPLPTHRWFLVARTSDGEDIHGGLLPDPMNEPTVEAVLADLQACRFWHVNDMLRLARYAVNPDQVVSVRAYPDADDPDSPQPAR